MSDSYLQGDDPMSEDIIIPCYSQRDETAQEVTEEILCLGVQFDAQQHRRAMRLSQRMQNIETGNRLTPRPSARVAQQKNYQPKEALDSEADSQEWLEGQVQLNGREDSKPKDRVSAGLGTNDDAQLDFELLHIHFFETEEERDVAQADARLGHSSSFNEKLGDGVGQLHHHPFRMFLVMIDPNASTYVKKDKTSPISRLTGHLLRIPNSRLTPALTRDKSKMNVIEGRMRYKLTHSRNLIKDLIVDSVGDPDTEDESGQPMDIITLCQQVIDLGSSKLTTDIKVSVEMCGRLAFLRETYVIFAKALATPSEKKDGGSKNHDKVRISTVIRGILADDRKTYGAADLDQLICKESPPMFT
ncbi:hypothetical protein DFH08DRAFT_953394 [Mycena albidolilacea]|uniref:Uncharacterized protein n=1 Tax=Mycena albidolilacea TaxID=1033008 RepID=A0AAD7EXW4_9AGAR|nr:hypothetical protein DFH08DRAFT_953394 [Mycena albidolilacea]